NDRAVAIVGWVTRWSSAFTTAAGRQVADRAVVGRRLWQFACEISRLFYAVLTPDEFLHRLLGFPPRPAGLAPARRTEDCHLQPEPVGLRRRLGDGGGALR